jgi:hypothetical protein
LVRFALLGSGSQGNALLVEADDSRLLLDCGFSVGETVRRLARLGLAPALAAAALAVLAVVAPWQRAPQLTPSPASVAGGLETAGVQPAGLDQVVIQSIETEDPDLPVMVYKNPESDVTVLWVFGLPQTDT